MRVFLLIQQAHTALFRAADHAMRNSEGITTAQNAVLFLLTEKDGQKISDLARQLSMGKSSLTTLIDRMERAKLVRRVRNRDDERISNIFLKPTGRAIVRKTMPVVRGLNAALLEPFDAEERKTIERFLLHMRQNAPSIIAEHGASAEAKEE